MHEVTERPLPSPSPSPSPHPSRSSQFIVGVFETKPHPGVIVDIYILHTIVTSWNIGEFSAALLLHICDDDDDGDGDGDDDDDDNYIILLWTTTDSLKLTALAFS